MRRLSWSLLAGAFALFIQAASNAAEGDRGQIKGLDEQVQEIKSDVLGITAELSQLEEKLLYPSNTQVSLFVSLAPGATLALDSVDLQLDGKAITHHLYTFKELEALRRGGVHRIYTGNIKTGGHDLLVSVKGKTAGGSEYRQSEQIRFTKDVGPRLVEVTLGGAGSESGSISYKEW